MNRRILGGYALVALLLSIAVFLPAHSSAQLGPHIATGDWSVKSSGPGFSSGTVHMVQQGYTIVGNGAGKRLSFSGKLNNEKLSGTWRGPTGETGWLTLTFSQSFLSFNGEYGYHGRKPEGTLIGKLVKHTKE